MSEETLTKPYGSENTPLLKESQCKDKTAMKTICQTTLDIFRGIALEPTVTLCSLCYGMEYVGVTNFWIDKICDNLYSDEICKNLNSGKYPTEQDNVQDIVAKYKSTYSIWIENLPAIFVILFLGAWCDNKDRKLAVILPLVGLLLKAIGLLLNNYFWSWSPEYILIASVPVGFGGAYSGFAMGYSSYLSVTAGKRSRTFRFALMYSVTYWAVPLGKYLTALLYRHYGSGGVFGCLAIVYSCNIVYSMIRLEKHPNDAAPTCSSYFSDGQPNLKSKLSPAHLLKTLSTPFRKRENGLHIQVLLHVIIIAGLLFDSGVSGFYYLYARKMFGWDLYVFTTWSEITSPISGIGTMFLLPILSYKYKVDDAILGFMGAISYMFFNIIVGTAPVGWVMYLAIGTYALSGMSYIASRGALSKLVAKDELGAIFALVAVGESIVPMLSGPFYTLIYNATLELFPGTVYLVAAAIFAVICTLYVFLITRPKRQGQKVETTTSLDSRTGITALENNM